MKEEKSHICHREEAKRGKTFLFSKFCKRTCLLIWVLSRYCDSNEKIFEKRKTFFAPRRLKQLQSQIQPHTITRTATSKSPRQSDRNAPQMKTPDEDVTIHRLEYKMYTYKIWNWCAMWERCSRTAARMWQYWARKRWMKCAAARCHSCDTLMQSLYCAKKTN